MGILVWFRDLCERRARSWYCRSYWEIVDRECEHGEEAVWHQETVAINLLQVQMRYSNGKVDGDARCMSNLLK
jgi:hypothetical protein